MEQSLAGLASAALIHLGRDPIADLDDVNDQTAVMLRERYPAVRDSLLRSYPWNFAMRIAALPGVKLDPPQFGFTHKCTLPSGGALPFCLRLWKLEAQGLKYAVKGRELYITGNPPVSIEYVARIDNPEEFDPQFYELLALDLALALVNRIPSDEVRKRGNDMRMLRRDMRRKATMTDAMEQSAGDTLGRDRGSWLGARRPL